MMTSFAHGLSRVMSLIICFHWSGSKQEICRRIIANQDYPTLTDSNHSRITQKNHLKEIRAQLRKRQQNAASNVPFEGDVCSVERLLTLSKAVSNLTGASWPSLPTRPIKQGIPPNHSQ